MTRQEALKLLAEGHSLWKVETAEEVCEAFGLELPEYLITRWKNLEDANPTHNPKGIVYLDEPDKPGEGVGSIELSQYVANQLKVSRQDYFGRGSQARANANAIAKKFSLK